jgi:hypothetical protein
MSMDGPYSRAMRSPWHASRLGARRGPRGPVRRGERDLGRGFDGSFCEREQPDSEHCKALWLLWGPHRLDRAQALSSATRRRHRSVVRRRSGSRPPTTSRDGGITSIAGFTRRWGIRAQRIDPVSRDPDHGGQSGQEEIFPPGTTLELRPYRTHKASWDHDHCIFLLGKAHGSQVVRGEPSSSRKKPRYPDVRLYGRPLGGEWVCPSCFEEFGERFEWSV